MPRMEGMPGRIGRFFPVGAPIMKDIARFSWTLLAWLLCGLVVLGMAMVRDASLLLIHADGAVDKIRGDEGKLAGQMAALLQSGQVVADQAQLTALEARPQIGVILRNTRKASDSMMWTVAELQASAREAHSFATEERAQLAKTGVDSDKTVKALRVVIDRTGLTMRHLDEALLRDDPVLNSLLRHSDDIAVNVSQGTADVQHEIHKLVYPPPRKWWQKWITDPVKIGIGAFKFTHPVGG